MTTGIIRVVDCGEVADRTDERVLKRVIGIESKGWRVGDAFFSSKSLKFRGFLNDFQNESVIESDGLGCRRRVFAQNCDF